MVTYTCPQCGSEVQPTDTKCKNCGQPLVPGQSVPPSSVQDKYAGFWKRFAAYIIDGLILFIPILIIMLVLGVSLFMTGNAEDVEEATSIGESIGNLLSIVIGWLYFAIMESSSRQATVGKMALGIKVTDLNGNRISFGRATGRHFAKLISGAILGIGYLMIIWTEKKQGLHDMIASCLVVNKEYSK